MRIVRNWMLSATAALGLMVGAWAVSAQEPGAGERPAATAEAKGEIAGQLLDQDGKGVAEAQVSLVKPLDRKARREQRAARQSGEKKPARSARGARQKPSPLATTTTDKDGKFVFKDIAVGAYSVRARLRGQGMAVARVKVGEGKTADVSMTLKPASDKARTKPGGESDPEKQSKRAARRQERKEQKKAGKEQS